MAKRQVNQWLGGVSRSMDKSFILAEIKRTAEENGGKPLGRRRFATDTGIKESDWYGRYWASWGAALEEAGYTANVKQGRLDDDHLLERFAGLVQELGRFPVDAEVRMKARGDATFPSHNTFRRFGRRSQFANRLVSFCEARGGLADVIAICEPLAAQTEPEPKDEEAGTPETFGSVYLLKAGRYYKIGRSNAVGRRERELAIQLPEKPKTIHVISTDDPPGIEAYWHNRFAEKRKNGEWFELSRADVQAFRRRKFM